MIDHPESESTIVFIEILYFRSYLVRNETLAKAAVKFELNKYIQHQNLDLDVAINKFIYLSKNSNPCKENIDALNTEADVDNYEVK